MKAKIRLMGLLCHLKNQLDNPKVPVAIIIIYLTGLCICANAQAPASKRLTLTGTVVSAIDGLPLEGALIKTSLDVRSTALTDKNGRFSVGTSSIKGNYLGNLMISLGGYDDVEAPFTNNSIPFTIKLKPINDPFRGKYPKFEGLKIGEKVPDIEFAIKNYHTPTAKISDFKGKLLILDFWTTYCASCINSFPKMEQLQKQYGDKIQVILVNVRENEEQIEARFKRTTLGSEQLRTMPSIVSSEALAQLFPHQFAGCYFWIDPEGILRLASSIYYNHNEQKINDVIDGKEITFIKHGKYNFEPKDKIGSLFNVINDSSVVRPEFSSIFTPADLDYYPFGGGELDQIDLGTNTIRNTYVNTSILKFYSSVYKKEIENDWQSLVYGPHLGVSKYLNPFLIQVKDSTLYDNRLISRGKQTDFNMIQSEFCYEQILPIDISTDEATNYMREDLDRFFGLKYGTSITIEEVELPCYLLKRASSDVVLEKEIKKRLRYLGKREFKYLNDFGSIIGAFYRPNSEESSGSWLPYVFEDEGLNKQQKIIMPVWKIGDKLEDFILALKANGLEYTKGEKKMKMIVVRDNQ